MTDGWNLQPSLELCSEGGVDFFFFFLFPAEVKVVRKRDPPGLHSGLIHPSFLSCSTRLVCKYFSPKRQHCFSWEVIPRFSASQLRAWKWSRRNTKAWEAHPVGTPPRLAAAVPWGYYVFPVKRLEWRGHCCFPHGGQWCGVGHRAQRAPGVQDMSRAVC